LPAAVAFFEAYLARFYGGMVAVLGRDAAVASLALLTRCAENTAREVRETRH